MCSGWQTAKAFNKYPYEVIMVCNKIRLTPHSPFSFKISSRSAALQSTSLPARMGLLATKSACCATAWVLISVLDAALPWSLLVRVSSSHFAMASSRPFRPPCDKQLRLSSRRRARGSQAEQALHKRGSSVLRGLRGQDMGSICMRETPSTNQQ